jgi:hypothetical protein
MAKRPLPVPQLVLTRLRRACMALPEVVEEAAWVGTRWCVRRKNFAHVLVVDAGWPAAYARAAQLAADAGPVCVLTFRSELPECDLYAFSGEPFFRPGWWPDIVGMRLGDATDWDEVEALVTASYCRLAPKKLAARASPSHCG